MGGRGSSSKIVDRLPNHKNAVIPRNKLKNYILNPDKDPGKSKFFNSIGYNMKNHDRLAQDIREGLRTNRAVSYGKNKYGHEAFEVSMNLGVNDKKETTTGWQIDSGSKIPKFITAYPKKKRKKG